MDKFGLIWMDEETGLLCQYLYFTTNGRCFEKACIGGVEKKAKRISEAAYISAWEQYKNY